MSDPTIEVTEGGVELPVVDVLTGRGAIFGKSGSGKSNTVGVIAEQLLEQNFPLLIIDADGEHYGLKEEYELLHVGATRDECDMAIGPEHADAIARVALDENVPIILDVSGYIDESVVDEIIRDVTQALFQREQSRQVPFPIFVEEAQEFIPETNHPDETAQALIRVAKRGRKRGLGLTAISQRPANVTKDVITQADWRIWHSLTWKNDIDIVKEVLSAEHAQAVQELEPGQALLDADFMGEVRTVQFKRKKTFDLGATPGLEDFERPELQPVSEDIIESLRSITDEEEEAESRIEELEAERDRLQGRIDTLEAEVERLEEGTDGVDSDVVQDLRDEKQRLERELSGVRADHEEATEKLERRAEQVEELKAEVDDLRSLREDVEAVKNHLSSAQDVLGVEVDETAELEAEYRDRVEELESELARLREENERLRETEGIVSIPTEYAEFYEHPTVEEAIEGAIEKGKGSAKAIWTVIFTIADMGEPVTYEEIQERGGYSTHTQVSQACTSLESRGVIKEVNSNPKQVDFNFDAMAEIEKKNKLREDMEDRIEQKVQ